MTSRMGALVAVSLLSNSIHFCELGKHFFQKLDICYMKITDLFVLSLVCVSYHFLRSFPSFCISTDSVSNHNICLKIEDCSV